jgi:hypothetical protein
MIKHSSSKVKSIHSRRSVVGVTLLLSLVCFGGPSGRPAWAQPACVGDCNHDDLLTIDELILGVTMALGTSPVDRCPDFDPGGNGAVSVDELVTAVNDALAGCGSRANHAPRAADVSMTADGSTPYVQKQLIGSDPDNDTITYELIAGEAGTGYSFAYVNPESGLLYVTLAADFQGTIVLPYRVTDGKLFSTAANTTLEVESASPERNTGLQPIDPKEYAGHPRGFFNGTVLGAPGNEPTLPSSVDLSNDFPLPGDQGDQNSCVGWALGYAIKTYQERVEHGWSLEALEHQFSPAYIYNQLNDGRDNGLIYNRALDLVVDDGVATLARMPYNDLDFLSQPSAAAHQEAAQFKVKSWKTANGTLEIKSALANRLAVFMAIQVFDDLLHLRGPDSVYNTIDGPFRGSHAVVCVGYDDNRYGGAFKIMNSWGRNYGDGGFFWIPYQMANLVVTTADGTYPIVAAAVVLDDLPDVVVPPPDPVDPPLPDQLPDLQVTDWKAYFDQRPGGSGSLQYTVTNTGTATAPAGAYVSLIVSRDPTFTSNNILVVYEPIPFDVAPGTTAYRDANNSIAFYFPQDLEPGDYYIAVSVDPWNDVVESNENDNVTPSATLVHIENTLPDVEVQTWYARWDEIGHGSLTYDVVNSGASTAAAGWLISFVLSPNDTIGDGDEIFLFSEPANYNIDPGGSLYRDESAPAAFSIFYDNVGFPVPTGVYYLALWLNPNQSLAESNTGNNASLSWGTVAITNGLNATSAARLGDTPSSGGHDSPAASEAYNGKLLPGPQATVRKVRIRDTADAGRAIEFLADDASADRGPLVRPAASHTWSKFAHARHQVIFPVTEAKPMPGENVK